MSPAMSPASQRAQLLDALKAHALRIGEFTLASGRTSQWYLDARQVTFRGDCVELVGACVLESVRSAVGPVEIEAVGGLTVGADPVALAVAVAARINAFTVRKEPKGHGIGGRFAGVLSPGQRVLVVDDSITSGASTLQAIEAIRAYGCTVVAASCIVDRGGEIGPILAGMGIPFAPIFGAPDLGFAFGT
jgi:orotate phosphoribosyltransferase